MLRRVLGILAILAATLGLLAVASPAQALSRSTWCSDWKPAGSVTGVGTLAERTCSQYLSTGQVRAVAEVRVTPASARVRRRAAASATPTPTASATAAPVRDGVIIRLIHSEPGDGLATKICRFGEATYSGLADDDPISLSCFSAYVPRQRGVARSRTWATVTDGGVTTGLPLTPYFTHNFA